MFALRQLLEHVLVAGPLGRIARAALLREHAEAHALARAGSRTASAATSGSRPRTRRRSRARRARRARRGSNVSSAADVDELLPLVVAQPPDVRRGAPGCCTSPPRYSGASPFDTSPRRAPMMSGRCSMPTGTLVLAGAAGRALPEHLLGIELDELRLALAREQRLLRLQNDRLRIELLARAPRRTVHLAASALDAGERIEHASCCRGPSPSRARPAPSRSRDSARCRARATSGTR